MAKNDIQLPEGDDYGPFTKVVHWPLASGQSFVAGEPVFLNTSGEVAESGDDPAASSFGGIALGSGDIAGTTDPVGTFRRKVGQFTPGATPNLPVAGDLIPVQLCLPGATLRSANFTSDGAAATTPTKALCVGEQMGLALIAGVYYFDISGTSANEFLRCTRVLDANGEDIAFSAKAGVWVECIVRQSQFSTVPA